MLHCVDLAAATVLPSHGTNISALFFAASRLVLRVVHNGKNTDVKIKATTRLGQAFDMFCQKKGLDPNAVRFTNNGNVLDGNMTPSMYGLQNQSVLRTVMVTPPASGTGQPAQQTAQPAGFQAPVVPNHAPLPHHLQDSAVLAQPHGVLHPPGAMYPPPSHPGGPPSQQGVAPHIQFMQQPPAGPQHQHHVQGGPNGPIATTDATLNIAPPEGYPVYSSPHFGYPAHPAAGLPPPQFPPMEQHSIAPQPALSASPARPAPPPPVPLNQSWAPLAAPAPSNSDAVWQSRLDALQAQVQQQQIQQQKLLEILGSQSRGQSAPPAATHSPRTPAPGASARQAPPTASTPKPQKTCLRFISPEGYATPVLIKPEDELHKAFSVYSKAKGLNRDDVWFAHGKVPLNPHFSCVDYHMQSNDAVFVKFVSTSGPDPIRDPALLAQTPKNNLREESKSRSTSAPPAGLRQASNSIHIKVLDPEGESVLCKLKNTSALSKLMNAYCREKGVHPTGSKLLESLEFRHDGVRLSPHRTSTYYHIPDGSSVIALPAAPPVPAGLSPAHQPAQLSTHHHPGATGVPAAASMDFGVASAPASGPVPPPFSGGVSTQVWHCPECGDTNSIMCPVRKQAHVLFLEAQ
eukprot:gene7396-1321_t